MVEERIDENVLGWFVHTERIWIDRNAIRVYMGGPVPMHIAFAGSCCYVVLGFASCV